MKVLVVDDDAQLSTLITFMLRHEGFMVITAADGQAALDAWAREEPDLVLLDVNLPKLDGYQVLKQIRAHDRTPVILLTVRSDEEEVVKGLDLGADDYVAKPFSPRTLLARVRAVLRRRGTLSSGDMSSGDVKLDADRLEVTVGAAPPTRLTPLECRLLQYLMANAGQVVPSDALIEHVWGYTETGDRTLLKQLVRRLRRKVEADPAVPKYVLTVANVGYSFAVERL